MSLKSLIALSEVKELSQESLELLKLAREKHIKLDEELEKQVENKTPSEELLNKRIEMSNYLLNVQRAIAQTDITETSSHDYAEGWIQAGEDLTYGLSLGSEHAVKLQIQAWTIPQENPYYESLDSESDKGYCERVKAIQLLMEEI